MLLNIKIMRDPDEQRIKGIIAPHQANVTVGSTTRVVDASYVGLERDRAVSFEAERCAAIPQNAPTLRKL